MCENIGQDSALHLLVAANSLPDRVLSSNGCRFTLDRCLLWSIIAALVGCQKSVGLGRLPLDDDPAVDCHFIDRMLNSNLGEPSAGSAGGETAG